MAFDPPGLSQNCLYIESIILQFNKPMYPLPDVSLLLSTPESGFTLLVSLKLRSWSGEQDGTVGTIQGAESTPLPEVRVCPVSRPPGSICVPPGVYGTSSMYCILPRPVSGARSVPWAWPALGRRLQQLCRQSDVRATPTPARLRTSDLRDDLTYLS